MANVNSTDSCLWCGEYVFANVARTKDEVTPEPIHAPQLESKPIQIEKKTLRIKK
jgi:hypothetical protein